MFSFYWPNSPKLLRSPGRIIKSNSQNLQKSFEIFPPTVFFFFFCSADTKLATRHNQTVLHKQSSQILEIFQNDKKQLSASASNILLLKTALPKKKYHFPEKILLSWYDMQGVCVFFFLTNYM